MSPPSEAAAPAAPSRPVRLRGAIVPVAALSRAEREEMRAVLGEHFLGVTPGGFEEDLAAKDLAILLREAASGALAGFSTLQRMAVDVDGEPVTAFFSGDTVVRESRRGDPELARVWGRLVFGLAEPGRPAYWFLISSGFRTYRFLPVFFREFYPSPAGPGDGRLRRVLDRLARARFPRGYDSRTGVIRLARPTPLRPGMAEPAAGRLRDPHVAFFVAANPGHARGDELACLTELSIGNLTPAGRRMAGLEADPAR